MHLPFPTPTMHVVEGWRDGHGWIVGSAFRLTLVVTTDKFTFPLPRATADGLSFMSGRNCRAAL